MDVDLIMAMIVKLVFIVIGILITRYLLPWLDKKYKVAKNEDIEYWVDVFVAAADQTLGVHCGTDEDKRIFVAESLDKMFPDMDQAIRYAVAEAAVKKLRQLSGDS